MYLRKFVLILMLYTLSDRQQSWNFHYAKFRSFISGIHLPQIENLFSFAFCLQGFPGEDGRPGRAGDPVSLLQSRGFLMTIEKPISK